jgi:hypothetical protein
MPFQNRVAPAGTLHAESAKGTLMGNRGILHDEEGNILRTHAHQNWVTCALHFKDRKQAVMAPGRYTQLFFFDEVTALSAGHRPCATCRRDRYRAFIDAWCQVHGRPEGGRSVPKTIDRILHAARIARNGDKVTFRAKPSDLPNGTIFASDAASILRWNGGFLRWSFSGYQDVDAAPLEEVSVQTPKPLVDLYAAGWTHDVQI